MTTRSPDAVVVGAGIAGAAAACFLAEAGLAVELIDAERPGFGASGRNPGFLWLQTKAAGAQMQFALAGRRFADRLAHEIGDFGFRASGGLIVWRDEAVEPIAQAFAEDRRRAGLPVDLLDSKAVHDLCPALGTAVRGAVWNPLDAHQDTRRLIARLIARGESNGLRVRNGARVVSLLIEESRCNGVRLGTGERLTAGATVVAAGPGSMPLMELAGYRPSTVLYKFEAAETAPAPFAVGPVICGQALFRFFDPAAPVPRHPIEEADPGLGFTEQAAQLEDGRIQLGCAFVTGTTDDRPTTPGQSLARDVLGRSLPGLVGLAIERQWAGIVLQTADGMPIVGPAPGMDGLWLDTGHFFGNLAGGLSGLVLAELITGRSASFDPAPIDPSRRALAVPSGPR